MEKLIKDNLFYPTDNLQDFEFALNVLENTDRDKYDRLLRICARLQMIQHLYHPAYSNIEKLYVWEEHTRDRLAAYLTATCIDVVAGKEEFSDYPDWLAKLLKNTNPEPDIQAILASLATATTQQNVRTTLKKAITDLKEKYLQVMGIKRGFIRVFSELPSWLKNWLTEVYIFTESGSFVKLRQTVDTNGNMYEEGYEDPYWASLSSDEKLKRIANYIYEEVRNKHTHTVDYVPTLTTRNNRFKLSLQNKKAKYLTMAHYKLETLKNANPAKKVFPEIKFEIGLLEGLHDRDVIRLVVVFELRKWLGITDNYTFIETYLQQVEAREKIFAFLEELKNNKCLFERWALNHLYSEPPQDERTQYLQREALLELAKIKRRIPDLPIKDLEEYNGAITVHFNPRIVSFEVQHGKETNSEKAQAYSDFLHELTTSPVALTFYTVCNKLWDTLTQMW